MKEFDPVLLAQMKEAGVDPEEIKKRMQYHESVEVILDFQYTINDMMEELTGSEEHNFDGKVVKNTQKYRIELIKRIKDTKVVERLNYKLLVVKLVIDDMIQLLAAEMEAREANRKLLTE